MIGTQCNRALKMCRDLLHFGERTVGKGNVVVIFGDPIVDGDGLADEFDG